jgi:hypothetical protein
MHIGAVRKTVAVGGTLIFMLAACAQPGPVLVQNIVYQGPAGTVPTKGKAVVGVSAFKDMRGKALSTVGKRTIRGDIENDLVVQGTAADIVTAALKDALTARGVTVKEVPAWDLDAAPGKSEGVDVLIGGEIRSFWVEATTRPLNVQVKASVQLRVGAADAAEGKVFRTLNLNSAQSREDLAFSFENVEGMLSEALSGALNQLMADDVISAKIK